MQQVSKTASVFEVSGKGIELLRRRLEMERFTALTYRDMSQFDPVIRVAEHKSMHVMFRSVLFIFLSSSFH